MSPTVSFGRPVSFDARHQTRPSFVTWRSWQERILSSQTVLLGLGRPQILAAHIAAVSALSWCCLLGPNLEIQGVKQLLEALKAQRARRYCVSRVISIGMQGQVKRNCCIQSTQVSFSLFCCDLQQILCLLRLANLEHVSGRTVRHVHRLIISDIGMTTMNIMPCPEPLEEF